MPAERPIPTSNHRATSYRPHSVGSRSSESSRRTEPGVHRLRNLFLFGAVTGSAVFLSYLAGIKVDEAPKNAANEIGQAVASIDLPSLPVEEDYQGRGELYDTPVEAGVTKQFMTEGFAVIKIPVRDEPGPGGDQVGFTLRGYLVDGQEWYGDTYPSDSEVGKIQGPDGNYYGLWFKEKAVPLFRETESGEYVPIGVVRDGYIAQNFLTRPPGASDTSDSYE